jgi:trehalose utilization protein
MIRVTVWNEFRHEQIHEAVRQVYPDGIHRAIAEGLEQEGGFRVRTATLPEPEHGLTQEVLDDTDVLIWWGHIAHGDVEDAVVERVYRRVLEGMGLVVLHSGHFSKIFRRLMGTSCDLKWREANEKERIWVVDPSHPIAAGLTEYFELKPEESGEVFRSGCTFRRGQGKIFYFRPGHETYPTFYHPLVRRVIANGVRWAAPSGAAKPVRGNHPPLEPIG